MYTIKIKFTRTCYKVRVKRSKQKILLIPALSSMCVNDATFPAGFPIKHSHARTHSINEICLSSKPNMLDYTEG